MCKVYTEKKHKYLLLVLNNLKMHFTRKEIILVNRNNKTKLVNLELAYKENLL